MLRVGAFLHVVLRAWTVVIAALLVCAPEH
jgi:hypothetical protein